MRRRFFWGRSLAQALARAARHHGLAPERLAYSVREKRHGFVKHPRAVIVEVDPNRPERTGTPPETRQAARAVALSPPPESRPATSHRDRNPRRGPTSEPSETAWEPPDSESEIAATEAVRRLLEFAGLDLAADVRRADQGLELDLDGADRDALVAAGAGLLDALEALLPRAIVALSGRRVHCRVDGAGLRAARRLELELWTREALARARARGEEFLPPLPPAERRMVHLALRDEAGIATESVGRGSHKRVRIYVTRAEPAND